MLLFDLDEVRMLASVVDDYFCDRYSSYAKLMEDTIIETVDPKECLIEFFTGYIVMAPVEQIEESIELFFEIPLNQMPLYFFPKPRGKRKPSETPCPSLEEGPYPWQVILAKWRTKLQR